MIAYQDPPDVLVVRTLSPVRAQLSLADMDRLAVAVSNRPIQRNNGNGTLMVTSTVAAVALELDVKLAIELLVEAIREVKIC